MTILPRCAPGPYEQDNGMHVARQAPASDVIAEFHRVSGSRDISNCMPFALLKQAFCENGQHPEQEAGSGCLQIGPNAGSRFHRLQGCPIGWPSLSPTLKLQLQGWKEGIITSF